MTLRITLVLGFTIVSTGNAFGAATNAPAWFCQRQLLENDGRLEAEVAEIVQATSHSTKKHVVTFYFSQQDPMFRYHRQTSSNVKEIGWAIDPQELVEGIRVLSVTPVSRGLFKAEIVATGHALREQLSPFNSFRNRLLWATMEPTPETERAAALSLATWIKNTEPSADVRVAKADEKFAVNVLFGNESNAIAAAAELSGLPVNVQYHGTKYENLDKETEGRLSRKLSTEMRFYTMRNREIFRIEFRLENPTETALTEAKNSYGGLEIVRGDRSWSSNKRSDDGAIVHGATVLVKGFVSEIEALIASPYVSYVSLGSEPYLSPALRDSLEKSHGNENLTVSLDLTVEGMAALEKWRASSNQAKLLDKGGFYDDVETWGERLPNVYHSGVIVKADHVLIRDLLNTLGGDDRATISYHR